MRDPERRGPAAANRVSGRAFTAHRETDFGRQRRRDPIRFRTSSFPAETANGPLYPPQTAENRGCSAKTGNSGLAQHCVVQTGAPSVRLGPLEILRSTSGAGRDCRNFVKRLSLQ